MSSFSGTTKKIAPIFYIAVATCFYFGTPTAAQAGLSLYLSPSTIEPRTGEVFAVELYMDATTAPINAQIECSLSFSINKNDQAYASPKIGLI